MDRMLGLRLSAAIAAGVAVSSASAQHVSHESGVSWSGMHGGVSWDGGHAYGGGTYGGYPAASPPPPVYKMPQRSPYATEFSIAQFERRREPISVQRNEERAPDRVARHSQRR